MSLPKLGLLACSLLLAISLSPTEAARDLPDRVKIPEVAKHYKEPNLCPYLGVEKSNLKYNFWTCTIPKKYPFCGSTTKFVYDCCPGFRRSDAVGQKCAEIQSAWRLIPDYLRTYDYPRVGAVLEKTQLSDNKSTSVYTTFSPFEDTSMANSELNFESYSGGDPHPILTNVAYGRKYSIKFKDGDTLPSLYKNQQLKITVYSNDLVFVECRALVKPDLEAKNGLIHILSGPIYPSKKSVMEVLRSTPETSKFAADIPSDLKSKLSDPASSNWFTVLAPTNSEWSKIKSKYSSSIGAVAKHHVIPRMICGQSITERATKLGPSLNNQYVGVDCDVSGKRYLLDSCHNKVQIVKSDLMGGNGVVHVLNGALVPSSVMDLQTALKCAGKSTLYSVRKTLDYIKACGIKGSTNKDTIFLATVDYGHRWFQNYKPFSSEYRRFQSDSSYRCNTFKYHVLKMDGKLRGHPPSWINQVQYKTSYQKNGAFSVNYYVKYRNGTKLYFENSRALDITPIEYKGGFIYLIDRVNVIPERMRVDILSARDDFSVVSKKIRDSNYGSNLRASGPKSLFLAPRNVGWAIRAENKYSGEVLSNYLKLHHVKLRFWGDDIGYFERETYQIVETHLLDGSGKPFRLIFKRMLNGNMYIGYDALPETDWAMVLEWNLYGTDGIIWVIDWPILCPPGLCNKLTLPEIDYFAVYATACTTIEGVASPREFDKDPVKIARKNANKCAVFKLPPKAAFRTWEVNPSG